MENDYEVMHFNISSEIAFDILKRMSNNNNVSIFNQNVNSIFLTDFICYIKIKSLLILHLYWVTFSCSDIFLKDKTRVKNNHFIHTYKIHFMKGIMNILPSNVSL